MPSAAIRQHGLGVRTIFSLIWQVPTQHKSPWTSSAQNSAGWQTSSLIRKGGGRFGWSDSFSSVSVPKTVSAGHRQSHKPASARQTVRRINEHACALDRTMAN